MTTDNQDPDDDSPVDLADAYVERLEAELAQAKDDARWLASRLTIAENEVARLRRRLAKVQAVASEGGLT